MEKGEILQKNILRNTDVEKIYISYEDKSAKRRYKVKLRFMDDKECYFAMDFFPDFTKPKRKTVAIITVYTLDGVYTANVTINDATQSMNDMLFVVTLPKEWHFKQMRQSSRKHHELPFCIKFNDGFEIKGLTYDIAKGGISFISNQRISSIYKKLPGKLTIKLSKELIQSEELSNFDIEARYAREQINIDDFETDKILYVWKFSNLSAEQEEFLKNYIICID